MAKNRKNNTKTFSRRNLFRSAGKPIVLAVKAVKKVRTNVKPLWGENAISRRQAIARASIGVGLIYGVFKGAKYLAARIPFWLGAKRRYSLLMSFGPHLRLKDANAIIKEVRRAKKSGIPYHVCFVEAADVSVADFAKQLENFNEGARKIPPFYKKLIEQGFSDENARLTITRNLHRKNPNLTVFGASQFANMTLEGLRIIPIEKHTVRNASRIKFLDGKAKAEEQRLRSQRKSGISLLEQQSTVRRTFDLLSKIDVIRNPVFENVVERFKEAERFFPELKRLPQIRAIGHLGSSHRTLYFTFNHHDPRIQLEEIQPAFGDALVTDFQLHSTPGKVPGKKGERIGVLAGYLDIQIAKLRHLGHENYVREIFRLVPAMSQKEFEELSKLTERISDKNKRGIFILNHLFGREIFK